MLLPNNTYSIKPLWWFWFPWFLAIAVAVLNATLGAEGRDFLYAENGGLETMQAFAALIAAGYALSCFLKVRGHKYMMIWIGVAFLGCLYIGLEEISYGQQILKWGTPEFWAHVNDQNETNLHNTSSWLDQKPKMLLNIGIVVGGMIIPLLQKYKPAVLPKQFNIIYPDGCLFWIAALTILAKIAKVLHKAQIISLYDRAAELNEFYVYYFVLLYLVMLHKRLKAQVPSKTA